MPLLPPRPQLLGYFAPVVTGPDWINIEEEEEEEEETLLT
jgi:hypothetical protein